MRTHRLDWFGLKPETTVGQEGSGNFVAYGYANGGSVEINEGVSLEKVIGGVVPVLSPIEVSVSLELLLTPNLLSILDDLMAGYGSWTLVAGNADGFGVKVLGCFPSEVSISCDAGEPVKVSLKFEGMAVTPLTAKPTITPDSGQVLHWWHCVLALAGNEISARTAKLDVKRSLQLIADLSTKPEGLRRIRNLYAFGVPEVTLSATLLTPFVAEFAEDSPSAVTWTLALGSNTISGSGVITKRSFPVKGGDDVWSFEVELQAFPNLIFA